tara:strand:- start:1221 stop:1646 length:426 start_codon:yes stop_codon:yes gene_type:complete
MYKLKSVNIILLFSIFLFNTVYAGCGNCPGDTQKVIKKPLIKKRSNSVVTTVPKDGNIEGLVITSCGMCNLGVKNVRSCSLSIKIDQNIFSVEGTKIHDYGDPHSQEGFCNVVRVAYVEGKIKRGVFHADSFVLMDSPSQN